MLFRSAKEPEPGIIDLLQEAEEINPVTDAVILEKADFQQKEQKVAEFEQVMNSGMQFLAGLFKMSTGKDMGLENQTIEVNQQTGEVVMRFKLPV